MLSSKAIALRIVHGLFCVYYGLCLLYLYYAAYTRSFNTLLAVCIASLAVEAFLVYGLNKGDCPLIHIQRLVGDEKPFFEIFFPPWLAKQVFPVVSTIAIVGLVFLTLRYIF